MDKEPLEAVKALEREENISKDTLTETIKNSLPTAYKNHFGKAGNVKVTVNPSICDFVVYAEKTVVENVEDNHLEMSLADAEMLSPKYKVGDTVQTPLDSKKFGRIVTQNTKNIVLQKICEEERRALYNKYYMRGKDVMIDVVQHYLGGSVSINLGRVNAILNESEQAKGETFRPTERVKIHVIEVKDTPKGLRVSVFRTHSDLVKRLFEPEVAEVHGGTAETEITVRETGSKTEIAVKPNDANVDPVGTCVGLNGSGVNSTVGELKDERIDIINWNDDPMYLIEDILSSIKVICVMADEEEREAQAIVPDYQLSLATSKEGQNTKLVAGLTGFKIDTRSRIQVREVGLLEQMGLQYGDTPSEAYEEEAEETESYREHEENYQEGGSEQQEGYSRKVRSDISEYKKSPAQAVYWLPGDEEQERNDKSYKSRRE